MKSKKKVLVTVLCAVLLVVGSVLGTMAYLTSQDAVTNTFTVGNVAITLDEADVDENGTVLNDDNGNPLKRVKANTYKLMPGHTYVKDPTIHVSATSEDCWLFVKVENGISAIEDTTTIAAQMGAKGWTLVNGQTDVYAYSGVVAGGTNVVVFDNFKIKGDAVTSDYVNASIKVTGYAVQADGFITAADAWKATFGAPTTSTGTTE